jgi:3-phytase
VPGGTVGGIAVTTIDQESSATYPIVERPTGLFGSSFVPSTGSGNPLSEGAQFLAGNATVSAIDGNWAGTEAQRSQLQARLDDVLAGGGKAACGGLKVMLVNATGVESEGLKATRAALLAAGDEVIVVAPAADQTATGSALTLADFAVTTYKAGFAVDATPVSTVATGLDVLLTGANRPDLVVSGVDPGSSVGLQGVTSATLAAAVGAVFNYQIPAISLNVGTDSCGAPDYQQAARFLVRLIGGLEETAPASGALLPTGEGLSVNVPKAASLDDYAFTLSDQATDSLLTVSPVGTDTSSLRFIYGAAVNTAAPSSEGTAYNDGKITVTPIDGNFASSDLSVSLQLADLIGTRLGTPESLPTFLGQVPAPVSAGATFDATAANLWTTTGLFDQLAAAA